jgi:hypothetical protein
MNNRWFLLESVYRLPILPATGRMGFLIFKSGGSIGVISWAAAENIDWMEALESLLLADGEV